MSRQFGSVRDTAGVLTKNSADSRPPRRLFCAPAMRGWRYGLALRGQLKTTQRSAQRSRPGWPPGACSPPCFGVAASWVHAAIGCTDSQIPALPTGIRLKRRVAPGTYPTRLA